MKNAVEQLETVVKAKTRRVLYLEEEVKNIKENRNKVEGKEPFKDTHEFKNSTAVIAKKIFKVVDEKLCVSKKDQFKCKNCDFKGTKEETLQKHINTKHEEHQCKECKEKLPSFMDLLKHVSKYHFKDKDDQKLKAEQDELFDNMLLKDLEENQEHETYSNFVFSESILDEFVDKKEL